MTDEFVTKGLENDRYLKALRLIEQFEDEMKAQLFEFDQRMVDQHPELFDRSTDPDFRTNRNSSKGLVTHRINHSMDGPLAPDSDQRLNVHLYWMPPTKYNRTDVDSALRAFGYKIKYGDEAVDEEVARQTRAGDWSLETSGNPYDDNTVFYRHVRSLAEIEATASELVDHFATFGDEYAASDDEHV